MTESNKEAKLKQKRAYYAMWRRKNRGLGPKGSSTPGITKGAQAHCVASTMDRFFAKYSRARKSPGYQEWLESHRFR